MKYILTLICFILTNNALAEIKTEEITYHADVKLHGFLVYDDAIKTLQTGLLIVHEWWGQNQHSRDKAIEFAKAGFVTFALDMYGEGKNTSHPKEAKEFMMQATAKQEIANRRFSKALEILQNNPRVMKNKIGALGYCFGGKVVLDQARLGTNLIGVASIHGSLNAPKDNPTSKIKTPILVLSGEDDPMVTDASLIDFAKEMTTRKANFEFVSYPGALHAFSNKEATKIGKENKMPIAYQKEADEQSQAKAIEFFKKYAK